jgi:hypothetical protein
MAQTQAQKVAKNSAWKKTPAGMKSQEKVKENIKERRKRGTYGKGGGDLSHPRPNKPGYTMEDPSKNRGDSAEKKKIANRKRKGYVAKYRNS